MVDLDTYEKYVVARKVNDKYYLYSFNGSISTVSISENLLSNQKRNAIGFFDSKGEANDFLKGCFIAARYSLLLYGNLYESKSNIAKNMSPTIFNNVMKSNFLLNDLSYFIAQSMISNNNAIIFKSYNKVINDLNLSVVKFDDISNKVDIIDFGRCYYNIVD